MVSDSDVENRIVGNYTDRIGAKMTSQLPVKACEGDIEGERAGINPLR